MFVDESDKLRAIRIVLMENLDPIGVKYEKATQDEYDAYLPGFCSFSNAKPHSPT